MGIKEVLLTVLGMAICSMLAMIPEAIMYGLWHTVDPQTELGKIILAIALISFGGGFCILFAYFGLMAFIFWLKETL